MSSIPTKECARGSHRTPFQPLHPGKLAFFSATNAVTTVVPPNWSGSPALPSAGTSSGQMGAATPPIVWFKRGPGTVVEIRPVLVDDTSGTAGQFRVFTASQEPSPNANVPVYQAQHVCTAVCVMGDIAAQPLENYVAPESYALSEIRYAKTITVANDKALPPGVKVLGDYGEGPASIVFDAGGAEWIGVAGAALSAADNTTDAVAAISFVVRSW